MGTAQQGKRQLRNFLLDARYQVTFTLPLVLVVAALFAGLGYEADKRLRSATIIGLNHIELAVGTASEEGASLQTALLERERSIRHAMVAGGLFLTLALMITGIVLTHRVAGPLHRVRGLLDRLAEGFIEPVPNVRRSDLLAQFFAALQLAWQALRERELRDLEIFRRALAAAEKDPRVPREALEPLRARSLAKEKTLG